MVADESCSAQEKVKLPIIESSRRGRPLLRGHPSKVGIVSVANRLSSLARKQDAGRDFLGRAKPAEKLPRHKRLARGTEMGALLQDFAEIGRVDGSRRDRVAADVAREGKRSLVVGLKEQMFGAE